MKLEGKKVEIRPLDSLNTRKETQDMSNISPDDKDYQLFLNLKERIPELKESFKKDIILFLLNINKEYDIEKINNIIDNLPIKFSPVDTDYFESKDDVGDVAYYSGNYVNFNLLDVLSNPINFKKNFYHELLHALSTDNSKIIYEIEDDYFKKTIGSQSTGLKFRGLNNKRFQWLNEAVTEQLAINLTKAEQSESYGKERKLFYLLNQKKRDGTLLDFNLILKTYFRHLKKEGSDDKISVDDWKDFSKEVDNAFEPRFLVKLDLFIEKFGIDNAIEVVSSWPDGQPNCNDLKINNNLDTSAPKDFFDGNDSEL